MFELFKQCIEVSYGVLKEFRKGNLADSSVIITSENGEKFKFNVALTEFKDVELDSNEE